MITCPNLMIFIVANLNKAIPCNSANLSQTQPNMTSQQNSKNQPVPRPCEVDIVPGQVSSGSTFEAVAILHGRAMGPLVHHLDTCLPCTPTKCLHTGGADFSMRSALRNTRRNSTPHSYFAYSWFRSAFSRVWWILRLPT